MDSEQATQTIPDTAILRKAGLTESQAKGYLALIEHGSLTPVELAEKTGESRTNGYQICEKLEKLGLATKNSGAKAAYSPAHPSALETIAERRRKVVQKNEQEVKNNINSLIDFYYEHAEMPGVRYLEGEDGQKKIYDDILAQKQPLYLVRTPHERKFFGKQPVKDFIAGRKNLQIHVNGITPFMDDSNTDPKKDALNLLDRQFVPLECYDAPVEIDIYGSRVGFIAYGDSLAGVIIDNPHIADAMRQLFMLARTGATHEFKQRADLVERLDYARQQHAAAQAHTE